MPDRSDFRLDSSLQRLNKGCHSLRSLAALTIVPFVLTSRANAQGESVTRNVPVWYKASGLSVWPSGQDKGNDLPWVLIGPSWNFDKTFGGYFEPKIPSIDFGLFRTPEISLGKTGAVFESASGGRIGLNVRPYYDGGRLDYNYGAAVKVQYPRYPEAGKPVSVKASFGNSGYSALQTTTPGFGAEFSAVAEFSGRLETEAYLLSRHVISRTSLIPSFSLGGEQYIGKVDFSIPENLNRLVKELNPTPVGVKVEMPDLSASDATMGKDGTLTAEGFGKFLSVETDLRDWILMFLPKPISEPMGRTLSGDYEPVGLGYAVEWDLFKANANLEVGFYGKYDLKPKHKIELRIINPVTGRPPQAVDANGKPAVTAWGDPILLPSIVGTDARFIMPTEGFTVTPTLVCDFELTNTFSLGTGGSIGYYPFSGGAKGQLSFNIGKETTVNTQFDVARVEWVGDPTAGTKLTKKTFDLPQQSDRSRTLPPIGVRPLDLKNLPSELFFGETPRIANVEAYKDDRGRGVASIYAGAPQGQIFFAGGIRSKSAVMTRLDGTKVELEIGRVSDASIEIKIPSNELRLGLMSIALSLETVNGYETPVSATYHIPLQSYAPNPTFDGEFNTYSDGSDPRGYTNRVPSDAGDVTLYCHTRGVFPQTEVVIDDKYVLRSSNATSTNPRPTTGDDNAIAFTIPQALIKELGGAKHQFRLRTPSYGTQADGTPYNPALSQPRDFFFMAGVPSITGYRVGTTKDAEGSVLTSVANGAGLLSDADVWFSLTGENFAQSTQIFLSAKVAIGSNQNELKAVWTSPTSLQVCVPAEFLPYFHQFGWENPSFTAITPAEKVPAKGGAQPEATSGGVSNRFGVKFAYLPPTINRIEQSTLIRGSGETMLRIYGNGLYRQSLSFVGTLYRVGSETYGERYGLPPIEEYGESLLVPYVDLPLPASMSEKTGTVQVSVQNPSGQSLPAILSVENGVPGLVNVDQWSLRVEPGKNHTLKIRGGALYPDTRITLNGVLCKFAWQDYGVGTLALPYAYLSKIDTDYAPLQAFNGKPGGGVSKTLPIKLVEGDSSRVKVSPAAATLDRATGNYRQSIAVTYLGNRNVDAGARIFFDGLPSGVAMIGAHGSIDGVPYLNVVLRPNATTRLSATFKTTGRAKIAYTPRVVLR